MFGIVPAAGHATRMFGIPKWMLPTPRGVLLDLAFERLQPVCPTIHAGTHFGYFQLLKDVNQGRAFIYMANTQTMSETVLLARAAAQDQAVAFTMPDTYIEDDQAFVKLAAALDDGADVAVGVFRAQPGQHRRGGMVDCSGGVVRAVVDKPETSGLAWIWGALAWRPVFWPLIDPATPHVGYALPRAIAARMDVRAVMLRGPYWDCGTPDEYFDCIAYQRASIAA